MSHTIIILMLAVAVCVTACEVVPIGTTAKLKKLQAAHYRGQHKKQHRSPHAHAAAQGQTYVSPQWLTEYHNLEAEHGDYTIPDDQKIQVESSGKIKVPHAVVRHFNDLSKAPAKTEEPNP